MRHRDAIVIALPASEVNGSTSAVYVREDFAHGGQRKVGLA